MVVLVKCPKCGIEFQDDEEVFHLESGYSDSNLVACDCGAVYRMTLEMELREAESE